MISMDLPNQVPVDDTTDTVMYGFGLDTDADLETGWPLDSGPLGGTDVGYVVTGGEDGWTLERFDADGSTASTAARAIIRNRTVLLVVPLEELGGVEPAAGRMYAFQESDGELDGLSIPPVGKAPLPFDPMVREFADIDGEPVVAAPDSIDGLAELLVPAWRVGDDETLMALLHPTVIEAYGRNACRSYIATLVDPTFDMEIEEIDDPATWTVTLAGEEYDIPDTNTVRLYLTEEGARKPVELHFADVDGGFYWFSPCDEGGG
jgi:hypothetical protein